MQFENFQNITSDHKSRNAREGSYDFLFIIFSTKLIKRATLYALLWCSNLALPRCFHSIFRIALYNLGLHSITLDCTLQPIYAFAIGQSETRYVVEYIIRIVVRMEGMIMHSGRLEEYDRDFPKVNDRDLPKVYDRSIPKAFNR